MRSILLGVLATAGVLLSSENRGLYADHQPDRCAQELENFGAKLKEFDAAVEKIDDSRELTYFRRDIADISSSLARLIEARKSSRQRDIWAATREFEYGVLSARREFHFTRWRVDNQLLDLWYSLNADFAEVQRLLKNDGEDEDGGNYNDDDRFSFQGEFGGINLRFDGRSYQDIYNQCVDFMKAGSIKTNELKVSGKTYYTGYTYWSGNQLCAIGILNAQRLVGDDNTRSAVKVSGMFAGVPFDISASSIRSAKELIRIAAEGLGSISTNEVKVNGKSYYGGYTYWSTEGVRNVILYNIERPTKRLVARGTLSVSPFVFAGNDVEEIRTQCEDYFRGVFGTKTINELKVNGSTRYGGYTYWNASQACMTVASLAVSK